MKQLLIISGKGGTGKTVLTAAFAALAKNKVMVDCDVDASDLYLLLHPIIKETHDFMGEKKSFINQEKCIKCGKCFFLCRFDAVKSIKKHNGNLEKIIIDDISCEGCGVCVWNCPVNAIDFKKAVSGQWYISDTKYGPFVHAKLGIGEENSGELVTMVKNQAKNLAKSNKCDLIIIDGPPGIGCPVIASLSEVDRSLIVTEPTLSGLHDAERIINVANHFGAEVKLVINKYDLNINMSTKIEEFCKKNNIPLIGKIKFDAGIIEAIVNGKTIIEYNKTEVKEEIIKIWEKFGE
jgi:MinD superfamily P-loop ATPase